MVLIHGVSQNVRYLVKLYTSGVSVCQPWIEFPTTITGGAQTDMAVMGDDDDATTPDTARCHLLSVNIRL